MTYRTLELVGMLPPCDVQKKLAVSDQTCSKEVIDGHPGPSPGDRPVDRPLIPYSRFSRVIDVCCMAEVLRNFNITSLRDDEIDRFLELQSFFFELETRCLDEAGFE